MVVRYKRNNITKIIHVASWNHANIIISDLSQRSEFSEFRIEEEKEEEETIAEWIKYNAYTWSKEVNREYNVIIIDDMRIWDIYVPMLTVITDKFFQHENYGSYIECENEGEIILELSKLGITI